MAYQETLAPPVAADAVAMPRVRRITVRDLADVLRRGLDDFWAMPTHVVFLALIYPVVGVVLARAAFGYELIPLLFPLAAGFALIGPFAAIGIYELSRRREQGLDTSWRHAFDLVYGASFRAILTLGLVLLVIFGIWVAVAQAIYVAHFDYFRPDTLEAFLRPVLTTPAGHSMILIGNGVGFLFALVAFSISVVAFPLLIDRNVGAAAAAATSVRAVIANPLPMALWGLIVAALLVVGSLPLFFGLAIVLPVLGHATWHLYRKVVEPDLPAREPPPPTERAPRSAADFPVALFPVRSREPSA